MASKKSVGRKLVVSGEDLESEDDEKETNDSNNLHAAATPAIAITDAQGKSRGVKVTTYVGEAPESDFDGLHLIS
jgi:hypothetical protein